jgi:hypothetical protein
VKGPRLVRGAFVNDNANLNVYVVGTLFWNSLYNDANFVFDHPFPLEPV